MFCRSFEQGNKLTLTDPISEVFGVEKTRARWGVFIKVLKAEEE